MPFSGNGERGHFFLAQCKSGADHATGHQTSRFGRVSRPTPGAYGCEPKPPESPPAPPKVTVSKPIVRPNEIDYDEFNGWLVAKDPVEIRSRVRGFVKEIDFKDPPKG